jgi:hypothetical protein
LLKVALNTIKPTKSLSSVYTGSLS